MSTFGDDMGDLVKSSGDMWLRYLALQPNEKSFGRAQMGAALITACAYAAITFADFGTVARHPIVTAIWAFLMVLGGLWFVLGVRGAIGLQHEFMDIFWAVVRLVAWIALLIWAYLPASWEMYRINQLLVGLWLMFVVSEAVMLVLMLRGPGMAARAKAQEHMAENATTWRPARPPPGKPRR